MNAWSCLPLKQALVHLAQYCLFWLAANLHGLRHSPFPVLPTFNCRDEKWKEFYCMKRRCFATGVSLLTGISVKWHAYRQAHRRITPEGEKSILQFSKISITCLLSLHFFLHPSIVPAIKSLQHFEYMAQGIIEWFGFFQNNNKTQHNCIISAYMRKFIISRELLHISKGLSEAIHVSSTGNSDKVRIRT